MSSTTIYAKTFPVSSTEATVRDTFSVFGRVLKVKLRQDEAKGKFRGSVYVTFDSEAAAQAAIANPPRVPGSSKTLQVMMQADYERKRAAAGLPVSSPGADEGSHKRARGGSGAEAPLPGPPPLPPSYGSHGHVHGGHGGHGHGSHGHGQGKGGYLEKEQLEEALQKERETNSALMGKLAAASQAVQDAGAREAAAARALLAKDVEISNLKGELGALRVQMVSRQDTVSGQLKARIKELEVQLQQLKDNVTDLRGERDRLEKALKAANSAAAAAGAGAAAGAAGGTPGGAGGEQAGSKPPGEEKDPFDDL